MANVIKDIVRIPAVAGALTAGVRAPAGGSFPVNVVHTRTTQIQRVKVQIPNLLYTVDTGVGGQADGQGQKMITLPAGKWMVLAQDFNLTFTTGAGLSAGTPVFALGTTAAANADATLSTTEANICASQTMTGTVDLTVLGTGTAPAIVGSTVATDVYLNLAGTFTHATGPTSTVTIGGTVELMLIDLGMAS